MKVWMKRSTAAILVAAGLLLAGTPAFAAAGRAFGMGLRSLGVGGPGTTVEEAAAVLDMTLDEVYQAKADGKTLAQIAAEKGVTEEALVAAIIDARTQEIEAQVAAGTITREAADLAEKNLQTNVEAAVEQECAGLGTACPGYGYNQGQGNGAGQAAQGAGRAAGTAGRTNAAAGSGQQVRAGRGAGNGAGMGRGMGQNCPFTK